MIVKRYCIKFVAFFIGCYGCYALRDMMGVSPVVASAAVGLIGSLIPFPRHLNRDSIHNAIYCGSFAGMCALNYLNSVWSFVIISAIGAFVYLLCLPYFKGHGGRYGSMALITFLLFLFTTTSLWNF